MGIRMNIAGLPRKPLMQRTPHRQRGIVLLIALTVLVAMSLAGVALMRSVDNTVAIAGNISFKQASMQVSERGTRDAMNWILTQSQTGPGVLDNDNSIFGYFSARPPTEPDWFDTNTWSNGNSFVTNGGLPDGSGNTVSYKIHRLCLLPGVPENGLNQQCLLYFPPSQRLDSNSKAIGVAQYEGNYQLVYRVTTRVDGPRNNVTVTQTTFLQ
jgi:hypothetical protein